jgi:subtilisin family serine protease
MEPLNEMPDKIPQEPVADTTGELSFLAVFAFICVILSLPTIIFLGQGIAWFLEQIALTSFSADFLSVSGKVWFLAQAVIVILVSGLFYFFSHNSLRPVYKGWLLAGLVTLPTFVLRFIGPNQDQLGALIQIAIGLVGGGIVLFARERRRRSLQFNFRPVLTALAIVPLVIWPFLLWGAVGSRPDIFLNLLAGLAFGLLAAGLVAKTTGNFLLDGLGIGVLLFILGSAFGYDGGQLLLIVILPAFGFAVAALAPSVLAVIVGLGLVAAAPLIFIDPTELAIVLGDFFPWAARAAFLVMANGLVIGLLLWIVGKWPFGSAREGSAQGRPRAAAIPLGIALLAWTGAFVCYFVFGLPGFYGDRLFVILKDQADLSQAVGIKDQGERAAYVYKTLTDKANQSQSGIRQTFDRFGVPYTPYYLVNAIEVEGGTLVRLYLATRPEVERVLASPRLRPLPPVAENGGAMEGKTTRVPENPGWNIKMIGADKVWDEFNATGKGIVVGQSDTGADGQHPALRASYRGATQGDDYNWYDPWNHTKTPTDAQGHGTHTLGTVLGSGGIGVAPGAQWIGCVNLARNLGNPALYLNCMQFLLAPFPQDGDPFKGDPSRGAQVLNNSWGCPPIEGCDPNALKPAADALRAAGIFVVVSVGNDGPSCSTVNSPLALYDSVFSVGAVDQSGSMAFFSSRGPVTVDGSGRLKPDIVAPGEDILSSLPGGGYDIESGTSMAGPHLVGVVALIWSANPALVGDIDRTEQILVRTAKPYAGSKETGCFTGGVPNDAYGYGLVDAYAAVKMALGK